MNVEETEASWGLADRGIGFQAAGFAFVGCVGVAILELFSGSNFWLYGAFETAATKMHWSLIVPLGALFDWGRRMFETGKAIREAKKNQIRDEGREKGREETIEFVRTLLEQHNVSLPPDVASKLYNGQPRDQP